jgi:hypothetical protein
MSLPRRRLWPSGSWVQLSGRVWTHCRGSPVISGDRRSILAELDRLAPSLIGNGRPARLMARRDVLAGLDMRGHPWARLLAACVAWEAEPGTSVPWREARAALQGFRRCGDRRGEGFACYVLGCWTLTQGRLTGAARWFARSRLLAGRDVPGSEFTLVHAGLGAYARGRLDQAIVMTEEAVAVARVRGKPRAEAAALVKPGPYRPTPGTQRTANPPRPTVTAGGVFLRACKGVTNVSSDEQVRGEVRCCECSLPLCT